MKTTSSILLSTLILLAACGQGSESEESAPAESSTPAQSAAGQSTAPVGGAIKIKRADGETITTVTLDGERVTITYADGSEQFELKGNTKDSGKRKYEEAGTVVAEVKPSDGGFKVRTPQGSLLWKVKISEEKIKISDNEENRNPWVLSSKHEHRVKILDPTENEIGAVKYYPDRSRVEVKDTSNAELFKINTDRESPAYGVLMMSPIPARERAIILAEILARER